MMTVALQECGVLWDRRALVTYLLRSQLQASTFQRSIGFLTWIIRPLALVLVYTFLLQVIFRSTRTGIIPFLFCALIPWQWMSGVLHGAPTIILSSEDLIQRVRFPNSVLVLAAVGRETVYFLAALTILVVAVWLYGAPITWALVALPLVVAVQALLAFGLALLFSGLGVFFRDFEGLLELFLPLWFYLSPGIYSVELVPESFRTVYMLNPMAILFTSYRSILLEGRLPALGPLAALGVAGIVLGLLALAIFVRWEQKFPKYL